MEVLRDDGYVIGPVGPMVLLLDQRWEPMFRFQVWW